MSNIEFDFFDDKIRVFIHSRRLLYKKHDNLLKNTEIRKLFNIVMDNIDEKVIYYTKQLHCNYMEKIKHIEERINHKLDIIEKLELSFIEYGAGVQRVYEEFSKFNKEKV